MGRPEILIVCRGLLSGDRDDHQESENPEDGVDGQDRRLSLRGGRIDDHGDDAHLERRPGVQLQVETSGRDPGLRRRENRQRAFFPGCGRGNLSR